MKVADQSNSVFSVKNSSASKRTGNEGAAFDDIVGSLLDINTPETMPDDLATSGHDDGASRSASNGEAQARHDELVDELHDWANLNPAEMIRAKYLAAHDLTEGDLSKMSADARKQIEDEIKKQVEEQAKHQFDSASDALSALSV